MTSTALMTELLCANVCGEVSTIQGCILQRACVLEAHGSCVPSGQHEQIPLQKESPPRELNESYSTRKACSKSWKFRDLQKVALETI